MQDQLREIITKHCVTLKNEGQMVSSHLAELKKKEGMWQHALTEALGLAHKIKGSSGTIGFAAICQLAEALELQLKEMRVKPDYPHADALLKADLLFQELSALLAQMEPEQSSLFNRQLG